MRPEEIVAKAFGQDPGTVDDATSSESLSEWDSLGHVTLIIELEAAYGVSFTPEEALKMTDVAAIKRTLQEHGATW